MTKNVVSIMVIMSLSARRAWIEISKNKNKLPANIVALRKESVDRNAEMGSKRGCRSGSLSARRAWIEICVLTR